MRAFYICHVWSKHAKVDYKPAKTKGEAKDKEKESVLDVSSCSFIPHTLSRAKANHFVSDNRIKCVKLSEMSEGKRKHK